MANIQNIFKPTASPSPGSQTLSNTTDANSQITPPINATTTADPWSFLLGTPGGANNPNVLLDASNDVYPTDNGDPEYSDTYGQLLGSTNADSDPSDLDPATFESWTAAQQAAYMALWGLTTTLIGSNVGGGSSAIVATASASGAVSVQSLADYATAQLNSNFTPIAPFDPAGDPIGSYLTVAPADLDPSVYQSWTQAEQNEYLQDASGGTNGSSAFSMAIGASVDPANAIVVYNGPSGNATESLNAWAAGAGASNFTTPTTPSASLVDAPSDLGLYGATSMADLDPSIFEAWTSEQQAEYMRFNENNLQAEYNGSLADYNSASPPGSPQITDWSQAAFVIGSDVAGATPVTAVLSSTDPNQVYIVNNLQATDLAGMPTADLIAVAATAEFQTIAPSLGLQVLDTSSSDPTVNPLVGIQTDMNTIVGTTPTNAYYTVTAAIAMPNATATSAPPDGTTMSIDSSGVPQFTIVTSADGITTETALGYQGGDGVGPDLYQANYTPNGSGGYVVTASQSFLIPATSAQTGGVTIAFTPIANASTEPAGGVTPQSTSSTMTATFDGQSYSATVANSGSITPSGASAPIPVIGMPAADKQVFLNELNIIYSEVANNPLVDVEQVSTEVSAVMQRYDQAALYYNQYTPTAGLASDQTTYPGLSTGVVSTDNNQSIQAAYNSFMQQETQILASMQNQYSLGDPANLDSPALDAPIVEDLGVEDMMNADDAEASIYTTELQQLQQVLQNVNVLESLLNITVQSLGNDTTDPIGFLGATSIAGVLATASTKTGIPTSELYSIIEMFDSNLNNSGADKSPALQLADITLPGFNLTHGDFTSSQWNTYSTDATTFAQEIQGEITQIQQQATQATTDGSAAFTMLTNALSNAETFINTIAMNW